MQDKEVTGDKIAGDKIAGDKVAGDKVAGDKITVGQISGAGSVVIGAGATAVYQGLSVAEVADLVVELKHKDQPTVWDGRVPYLGLRSYRESDAQFFFGRESLVQDLLKRMQEANLVTVVGPSGSGKSSVVRAGLFQALKTGRLEKSDTWPLLAMQPKEDPVGELALAVSRMAKAPTAGNHIQEHAADSGILYAQLETFLSDDPDQRCVLFVDQFEELFTQTKDEQAQGTFINLLTTTAEKGGRIIIILAMRSDFVSNVAKYPRLRTLVSRQFQLVGMMEPRDLAKAITLPALEVGAVIDPQLVTQIINDMKGEPGALPLMSFALRDLFEAEKTKPGEPMDLTLAEYITRGGLESMLERHANHIFKDFSPEQIALAQNIFSKLIEIGADHVDTSRTATFRELIPEGTAGETVQQVVRELSREGVRLIAVGGMESGKELDLDQAQDVPVTLAHERLIDAWPWLRHLVDENRQQIALENQIAGDARKWQEEQDDGYLLRGGRLLQVEEQLPELKPALDSLSLRFIQASIDEHRQIIARENAQRRKIIYILSGATAIALILTFMTFIFYSNSQDSLQVANVALTAEATALIESNNNGTIAANEARSAQTAEAEALAAGTVAAQEAEEANRQAKFALAQSLSSFAPIVAENRADLELIALLQLEAMHIFDEVGVNIKWQVDRLLRESLAEPVFTNDILGYAARVTVVSVSPDGLWAASSSDDRSVRVWPVDQPDVEPVLLSNFEGNIQTLAFAPDNRTLAGGSTEGQIYLWDVQNLNALPQLLTGGHTGAILSLAFSPTTDLLASAGTDSTVQLWDYRDVGPAPSLLYDHESRNWPIGSTFGGQVLIAFSPDGTKFVSALETTDILMWDTVAFTEAPQRLAGHERITMFVAFAPDNVTLASGGADDYLLLWDLSDLTAQTIPLFAGNSWARAGAFSSQGDTLAVGLSNAEILLWDLNDLSLSPTVLTGHLDRINSMAFAQEDTLLFSASDDATVRLWRFLQGNEAGTKVFSTNAWINAVDYAPDGTKVAAVDWDGYVYIWDVTAAFSAADIVQGHEGVVEAVAFSPDGELLATASRDQTIRFWRYGEQLENVETIETGLGVFPWIAFSPDGRYFAATTEDGLQLWSTGDFGQPIATLSSGQGISGMAFSDDGELLATYDGREILIWSLDDLAVPMVNIPHEENVLALAFSDRNGYVATGGFDNVVRLWSVVNPDADPIILSGHAAGIRGLDFSPDNTQLASASDDGTIRIWDLQYPRNLPIVLADHEAAVFSVRFAPDGEALASGGWDNNVRVRPTLHKLIRVACVQVGRNLNQEEWASFVGAIIPYRPQCDLREKVPSWWGE